MSTATGLPRVPPPRRLLGAATLTASRGRCCLAHGARLRGPWCPEGRPLQIFWEPAPSALLSERMSEPLFFFSPGRPHGGLRGCILCSSGVSQRRACQAELSGHRLLSVLLLSVSHAVQEKPGRVAKQAVQQRVGKEELIFRSRTLCAWTDTQRGVSSEEAHRP